MERLAEFLVSISAGVSFQEQPRLAPSAATTAPQGDMPHLRMYTGKRHTAPPLPFGTLQTPFQFSRSKVTLEEERGKQ